MKMDNKIEESMINRDSNSSDMNPPAAGLIRLAKLGKGTYGHIYSAENSSGQRYAVKRNIAPREYLGSMSNIRELNILLAIKNHPFCIQLKEVYYNNPFPTGNMSPVKEVGYTNDKLYFAMEQGTVDGNEWLHKYNPSIPEKKLFLLHILLGVEFLHSRNIYHRDLKPANVICFLQGGKLLSVKITDYGLAQFYTTQNIPIPKMVTLWYRAPEISLHKHYTPKVDIWSVGCIAYETMTISSRKCLFTPEEDYQLLNAIIDLLPCSYEDYSLAKNNYRELIKSHPKQSCIHIKDYLGFNQSTIAQFNSLVIDQQYNHGLCAVNKPTATFDNFADLLQQMLSINHEYRPSATKCLNHPFFAGYIDLIDRTRGKFQINRDGVWIAQPATMFIYHPGIVRQKAMYWLNVIYNHRNTDTLVCKWYTHRIFFHGLDLIDRYLYSIKAQTATDFEILLWVNTCLFISSKFFRIMESALGIYYYVSGIPQSMINKFVQMAPIFEETLIKTILCGNIYQPTIYEYPRNILSEVQINKILDMYMRGCIPVGTTFRKFWADINQSTSITHVMPNTQLNQINKQIPIISI